MKTLYLDGARRSLVLLDGPALRVVSEGRAESLYPFRRLARVVVCGPVRWDGDALLACLEGGIPVTFLNSDGEPRAWCLAPQPRPSSLSRMLDDFLARPDWLSRFQNWRRAAERGAILAVLRRLALRAPDLRPDRVARHLLDSLVPQHLQTAARAVLRYLDGLLAARVCSHLAEAGIQPHLLIERRPAWNLPADFSRICSWHHYLWLPSWSQSPDNQRTCPAHPDFRRRLTELFESHIQETSFRIRSLLDRFSYWLGGLL